MNPLMFIPLIGTVLDKIFPDKTEAARAQAKLIELQMSGELQQVLGQLEINKVEAASGNWFVAGWRPGAGWVCVLGLLYNFVAYPIASWWAAKYSPGFTPPPLLDDHLMELILGMLGMGGLRTWEKSKGVAK